MKVSDNNILAFKTFSLVFLSQIYIETSWEA